MSKKDNWWRNPYGLPETNEQCPYCGYPLLKGDFMNFAICLTPGCPANFFLNFRPWADPEEEKK